MEQRSKGLYSVESTAFQRDFHGGKIREKMMKQYGWWFRHPAFLSRKLHCPSSSLLSVPSQRVNLPGQRLVLPASTGDGWRLFPYTLWVSVEPSSNLWRPLGQNTSRQFGRIGDFWPLCALTQRAVTMRLRGHYNNAMLQVCFLPLLQAGSCRFTSPASEQWRNRVSNGFASVKKFQPIWRQKSENQTAEVHLKVVTRSKSWWFAVST